MEDWPNVHRRPGTRLIVVKRDWVPMWLFHRLFVLTVRYRAIRWILGRTYPK